MDIYRHNLGVMRYVVTKEAEGWTVYHAGPPYLLKDATQEQLRDLRERGHPGIEIVREKKQRDTEGGATD